MSDNGERPPQVDGLPDPPVIRPVLPRRIREDAPERRTVERMGLAYSLPAALAAPVIVLTFLGAWVDGRFHASPVGTLAGAVLGSLVGLMNMIRLANRLGR